MQNKDWITPEQLSRSVGSRVDATPSSLADLRCREAEFRRINSERRPVVFVEGVWRLRRLT